MRLLRDSAVVAPRLAHVLSTSRYVAQMLPTLPDAILWFDDDDLLAPRHRADMVSELDALMKRRSDPRDQAMAGRYLRRREMLRMAIGQVLRAVSPEQVREALSDVMDLAVSAALRAAVGDNPLGLRHAVIALGRLGGREIGYVSDADLMFVYEAPDGVSDDDAYREAQRVTTDTLAFLKTAGAEPAIDADIKLRPEGKHGAITRSVSSYLAYYERWGKHGNGKPCCVLDSAPEMKIWQSDGPMEYLRLDTRLPGYHPNRFGTSVYSKPAWKMNGSHAELTPAGTSSLDAAGSPTSNGLSNSLNSPTLDATKICNKPTRSALSTTQLNADSSILIRHANSPQPGSMRHSYET